VQSPSGYTGAFTVQVTVSDGHLTATESFQVAVVPAVPPTLDPIANRIIKAGQSSLTVTLSGHTTNGNSLTYTAAASGTTAQIGLAVQGNQLTIQPPAGFSGSFTVQVTLSDGFLTATQSFQVTVLANTAPTLDPIGNQTMKSSQGTLTVALSGHDANGNSLTYSAQVQGGASNQAYQVKQQLGLSFAGSYYTNAWGMQEKWLLGTGNQWYILLPDGELRKWLGSMTATLSAAGLVATLNSSYYADPSLLWQAQPAPTLVVTGNQLTIQVPSGFTGNFTVQVTVNNGFATATQTFTVTVTA
jgi:hypothetical protein